MPFKIGSCLLFTSCICICETRNKNHFTGSFTYWYHTDIFLADLGICHSMPHHTCGMGPWQSEYAVELEFLSA